MSFMQTMFVRICLHLEIDEHSGVLRCLGGVSYMFLNKVVIGRMTKMGLYIDVYRFTLGKTKKQYVVPS